MNYFLRRGGFLFFVFGAIFLCYSFIRLFFYISNIGIFQTISFDQIIFSFVLGWRFDLSIIIQINILFLLIYALPLSCSQNHFIKLILQVLFLCTNLFFICIGIVDTQYFPFVQGHISADIVHILRDTMDQFMPLLEDYWWIFLILLLTFFTINRLYLFTEQFFLQSVRFQIFGPSFVRYLKEKSGSSSYAWKNTWKIQLGFFFSIVIFSILAIRGGLQQKVLDTTHAQVLGSFETSTLMLNAPFTLIRSVFRDRLEKKNDFPNKEELKKWLSPTVCSQLPFPYKERPKNVVLIVIESLGPEFIGAFNHQEHQQSQEHSVKSYTPFYDSLTKKGGALFLHGYSNGHRSIQAIPALLAGLPNWFSDTLVKTRYIGNRYPSLGGVLKKHGFRTLFSHGGHNGTMYFDATIPYFGLDEYYGYDQFPVHNKHTNDGAWGIFDEDFFLFTVDVINEDRKRPFLAVLFSVSSHHPFVIPKKYSGKFPKGPSPQEYERGTGWSHPKQVPSLYYESIGYTDHSLKLLFQKIYKQSWAKETLFIITPDHTPIYNRKYWNKNSILRRRIPILYYWPEHDLSFLNSESLTQQLDIFPTVLDFLGVKEKSMLPFGNSLLKDCGERHVIFFEEPSYWFFTKKQALFFTPSTNSTTSYIRNGDNIKPGAIPQHKKEIFLNMLKAKVQHYNNGLLYNTLLLKDGL